MARRPALEREEVFDACNRLQADGKEVSATALLDALGGGSLRTIYRYLEDWKKEQPEAPRNTEDKELPENVLVAFKATWRAATAEADRATAAVRDQAAEEVKAAQKQFSGALDAIEKLEAQSDQDGKTIEELTARVAELEAAMRKAQTEAAASKTACDQLKSEVAKLEVVGKQDRKERDAAMKEAATLTGQLEALKEQNAKLMESLKPPAKAKK